MYNDRLLRNMKWRYYVIRLTVNLLQLTTSDFLFSWLFNEKKVNIGVPSRRIQGTRKR